MKIRKMMKILLLFVTVLLEMLLPVERTEAKDFGLSITKANGYEETTLVELYAIDSVNARLVIPPSYEQQYQINLSSEGTTTYKVIQGESATVSENGCIHPAATVYYWNGNVGSTVSTGAEGETSTIRYTYDEQTVIEASVNRKVYRFVVTVKNYAQVYADQVMDAYLSENITDSMTNMEKLKKIAEFPCKYDYSVERQSVVGMIIDGGGDCWASTDAIVELCKKVGLDARSRDGRGDPGAGSGHMNARVKIEGKLYIVEAGYNERAPRHYKIMEEDEYSYRVNDDNATATLTKYNGMDRNVDIPQYIDGYPVTVIGADAFAFCDEVYSVLIPSSVKIIETRAFYCTGLQSVRIPEGVEVIGDGAFFNLVDYQGPLGGFGEMRPLEIVELPASIKSMGIDLSESVVFYHGTREQWENIVFTEVFKKPKPANLFFSSDGLEVSDGRLEIACGNSGEISVYTMDEEVKIIDVDSDAIQASLDNDVHEYYYYRDGSNNRVVSVIRTLKITALKEGSTEITIAGKNNSIRISVNISAAVPNDYEMITLDKCVITKIQGLKGKKLKVTWKKVENAKGYEVAYSNTNTFANKATKLVTTNMVKIGNIKKKTYFVKVRAYKVQDSRKIYGKWSAVKRFKVK